MNGGIQMTNWLNPKDWQRPEQWLKRWFAPPSPSADMDWPLDWLLFSGGPVRRAAESLLNEWADQVPSGGTVRLRVLLIMPDDPLIQHERVAWMQEFAKRQPKVRIATERVSPVRVAFDASRFDWAKELLGEQAERLRSECERFARENRQSCSEPPWIFWSRFPMWLRMQAHIDRKESVDADLKLSAIRVALSPHDEEAERAALQEDEIKLNPAFDVVNRGDALTALVRQHRFLNDSTEESLSVFTRTLDPLDAFIIDCIREDFRISRADLLLRIQKLKSREFDLAAQDRIDDLEEKGLLLAGAPAHQALLN